MSDPTSSPPSAMRTRISPLEKARRRLSLQAKAEAEAAASAAALATPNAFTETTPPPHSQPQHQPPLSAANTPPSTAPNASIPPISPPPQRPIPAPPSSFTYTTPEKKSNPFVNLIRSASFSNKHQDEKSTPESRGHLDSGISPSPSTLSVVSNHSHGDPRATDTTNGAHASNASAKGPDVNGNIRSPAPTHPLPPVPSAAPEFPEQPSDASFFSSPGQIPFTSEPKAVDEPERTATSGTGDSGATVRAHHERTAPSIPVAGVPDASQGSARSVSHGTNTSRVSDYDKPLPDIVSNPAPGGTVAATAISPSPEPLESSYLKPRQPTDARDRQSPPTTSRTPSPGTPELTRSSKLHADPMSRGAASNGNGRLSPASAERVESKPRDVLFKDEKPSTPHGKRPTEPATSATKLEMEHIVEVARKPAFIVLALISLVLTAITFGWRFFAWLLSLVVVPFIARYILPYPASSSTEDYPPKAALSDSVAWVNHALRTLFPLVSADVLTPFVDLLEDALIQQVPPIVTSVRITSVSLGVEPVLLTSFKPISDDEWFAAIAQPDATNGTLPASKNNRDSLQGGPTGGLPSATASRASVNSFTSMTGSQSGAVPSPVIQPVSPSRSRFRDRTLSSSSKISRNSWQSAKDSDQGYSVAPPNSRLHNSSPVFDGAQQQVRKRDRILARLKRHRNHAHEPFTPTTAALRGHEVDDLNSDQYVNYEVGFTYRHSPDVRARGKGIHMIAHFGWGVRGLGGSEIPVYLDVARLRGKLRVRILLAASPPFAREVSFSFVSMPEFDISARPLRAGSFNAMDIPLIKTYVEKSVAKVAEGFVAPLSFTMDVDRLLMGHDYSLRTQAMGVFHIVIHSASNLPRTDTVGSCDPYLSISFSKFNKPLFSTRTIVSTLEPFWEEDAFILVPSWAIATGEKLRLRVCDSDRFSADDLIGKVEVDVAEMVEWAQLHPNEMMNRQDALQPARPGMRVQGEVEWSLRFHPLWQMAPDELQKRVEAARDKRGEGHTVAPWWLSWLDKYVEVPEWEKERAKKRKETQDIFTGESMRDEVEAAGKPSDEFPSGVIQFHIHQCSDLELESLSGTFSGASMSRRKSAASGKPAMQDVIDRTAADNVSPPSAYCEVHINDKFVYRTRTKQLTPVPYFNAVSERFIRDWRVAKIVFVVKDQRDREHDPILGVVSLRIRDVLKNQCQVTGWYPLVGGLGWGRLRISLLFKPIDIHVPQSISSFETATFDVTSLTTTSDFAELAGGRPPILFIESEYSRATLRCTTGNDDDHDDDNTSSDFAAPQAKETGLVIDTDESNPSYLASTEPSPLMMSPAQLETHQLEATKSSANNRNRESFSRIRGTIQRRRDTMTAKKNMSTLETHNSGEVEWHSFHRHRAHLHHDHPIRLPVLYRHSCSLVFSFVTKRMLKKSKVHAIATLRLNDVRDGELTTRTIPIFATNSVRDAMKALRQLNEAQKFTGATGERLSGQLGGSVALVGYAKVTFVLHPGVSRAHRNLAKRDLKFRSVYNAWEAVRAHSAIPTVCDDGISGEDHAEGESEYTDFECDDDIDHGDSDDSLDRDDDKAQAHAAAAALRRDDTRAMLDGAHNEALHKRNRGIFQLKLARTGKLVKDKVEAKLLSTSAGGLERRARGMDMEVEHEGQSRFG